MPRVEGSGRKQCIEWTMVNKTDSKSQVTCKFCNSVISAKVERIRVHMNKCKKSEAHSLCSVSASNTDGNVSSFSKETSTSLKRKQLLEDVPACQNSNIVVDGETIETLKPKHQRLMGEFSIKTNDRQRSILDQKVSEFFYANNISFNIADSDAFRGMINALRPGYVPPNRKRLAGSLLDEADKSVDLLMEEDLKNATITLMLDGWSNTNADSIIAVSIHTGKSTYLLDAIECGSQKKTAEFCAEIAEKAIDNIKQKYGKNVFAVCCDNENKMKKFRDIIVKNHPCVLAFGCSAHYMNLLVKEIIPKDVIKYVVEIQKFFRYHHRPLGWLMEKNGQKPQLPNETRWNSGEACLSSFVSNYQKYVEISIEHNEEFEKHILTFLDNKGLYRECVNLQVQLSIVAKALDSLQKDDCTLAQTVEIWLDVYENKELTSYKDCIKHRLEEALTPFHFLANMTDPALSGKRLTYDQEASAEQCITKLNTDFLIPLKMFKIRDTDFYQESMFLQNVIESIEAKKWWKIMHCKAEKSVVLNADFCQFLEGLHSITSTSASIERIFSTFGLVWCKLRNQLGCDKAKKLVKVYRSLKSKGVTEDDW